MSTFSADPKYLIHVLDTLVVNFLSPDTCQRLDMILYNRNNIESDPDLYKRYDHEVNDHIENLSSMFAIRDKAAQYFKELPQHIKINLKGRYEIAKDLLKDAENKTLEIPADITILFKWFFIEFWYNSKEYIGF